MTKDHPRRVDVVRSAWGPDRCSISRGNLGVDGGIRSTAVTKGRLKGLKMLLNGRRCWRGIRRSAAERRGEWSEGNGRSSGGASSYTARWSRISGGKFRIGWDAAMRCGADPEKKMVRRLPGEHHTLTRVAGGFTIITRSTSKKSRR